MPKRRHAPPPPPSGYRTLVVKFASMEHNEGVRIPEVYDNPEQNPLLAELRRKALRRRVIEEFTGESSPKIIEEFEIDDPDLLLRAFLALVFRKAWVRPAESAGLKTETF